MSVVRNRLDTQGAVGIAAFVLVASVVTSAGCGRREVTVGVDEGGPILAPSTADAGEGGVSLAEPALMCPVTTCTLPWTTCPSTEFPCGTNLLTDDNNCGGCGIRCAGTDQNTKSKWTCVDGQCKFSCVGFNIDCDGDLANGCEVAAASDEDNCGYCGNKCEGMCQLGTCVDACAQENRPDVCDGQCTNLKFDSQNCGVCGNVCDPTDPTLPPLPADMHYGCGKGICGQHVCSVANMANCNGDLSDGCEAAIHTDEHCGGCYDACPIGKHCAPVIGSSAYACLCLDDAETYCNGQCIRLADDPEHCGGCFNACPGLFRPHFEATCTFGVCGGKCEANYADCDGISENGCEIDTFVDNRNCGGCGNACLPNQVCSQGTCLVAPCDAGVPGDPTK